MKKLTKNPIIRRIGIPIYRLYASQCQSLPEPRVLAMSMPKAGTHLLGKLLSTLPQMMFSGLHLDETHLFGGVAGDHSAEVFDQARLMATATLCRPGQYMTGHFPATPELQETLAKVGIKTVLILRDPRDVAVSYAHYVTQEPRHAHYKYFNHGLETVNDRIMAVIRGFSEDAAGTRGLVSVGRRIDDYLGWMANPAITVCRFESLVGSDGGGCDVLQKEEVKKISESVSRPLDDEAVTSISQRVFTRKSRTFRKGQIGDWANSFTDEHRAAFKEVGGEQLIQLGYETDLNW